MTIPDSGVPARDAAPLPAPEPGRSLARFRAAVHRRQQTAPSPWEGTLADFLDTVLASDPQRAARDSHRYLRDMLAWRRRDGGDLVRGELFGLDGALEQLWHHLEAAAGGGEAGKRLLLLLGPPAGGKSSLLVLLKRGLEAYSRSDEGALYAVAGCPLRESPLNLIPYPLRQDFQAAFGVLPTGQACPHCQRRLQQEYGGDFLRMPVERIILDESHGRGIGSYAPHDPATADPADLVGSVDLARLAQGGDEADPRAWSWSGALWSASRGLLEMIEVLKVKREFLHLLLTLTQERNVKVGRFPLIHLDTVVLAHTNLTEFRRCLAEPENEALLDRMVIVPVPYVLSYRDEARIYRKLLTPPGQPCRLAPHAGEVAAVFAVLTRLEEPHRPGLDLARKVRLYAGETLDGAGPGEARRERNEHPEEGMSGISPRFVVNALACALARQPERPLTALDALLALREALERDLRLEPRRRRLWQEHLVTARQGFYNRWVAEDVQRSLFPAFAREARHWLERYLQGVRDWLARGVERAEDEPLLRAVEQRLGVIEAGKGAFRREVARRYPQEATVDPAAHPRLLEAIQGHLFEERREDLERAAAPDPDDRARRTRAEMRRRLARDYGYGPRGAREALDYVATLLARE